MPVLVQPTAYTRRRIPSPSRRGAKAITGILIATRFFRLKKPIRVSERRENGIWIRECVQLGIHAYGTTPEESWQAFVELFESDWDSVAQERDSRLTKGARQLKWRYLERVESVEPAL